MTQPAKQRSLGVLLAFIASLCAFCVNITLFIDFVRVRFLYVRLFVCKLKSVLYFFILRFLNKIKDNIPDSGTNQPRFMNLPEPTRVGKWNRKSGKVALTSVATDAVTSCFSSCTFTLLT